MYGATSEVIAHYEQAQAEALNERVEKLGEALRVSRVGSVKTELDRLIEDG